MRATGTSGSRRSVRVLQLGPLYVDHVRRWSERAAMLGFSVFAAGHVRDGRRAVDLADVADRVEIAPASVRDADPARQAEWTRELVRRLEPDVVQAHWLPRWGHAAALAGGRPLIVSPWGSDVYMQTGASRARADLALRSADRVLARSHHMRREILSRGVEAGRVELVDLGVDLERFRPVSARERALLRRDLNLPAGPVILSFRAGTELYNLDGVVDAFGILRRETPGATLVLVHGEAPLAEPVRSALRTADVGGAVRVAGAIPHAEMPRYFQAADVGVSIPSSDGSPNSVWEALACGLPVVASDLPQIRERVGRSGAVRLVEPNAEATARALLEIVTRGRDAMRMSSEARAWAETNLDRSEQVKRLGNAYAAVLDEARGVPLASPS